MTSDRARSGAALRAGRRIWLGIPGPRLDPATSRLLEDVRPGGVVLFARNIVDLSQVRDLCHELRDRLDASLHIAIDHEGGAVVRFRSGVTTFPGNRALGRIGERDPELAEQLARAQGEHSGAQLAALGIDVNFAPCVDLYCRQHSPIVGNRAFSADPELTGRLATALIRGHLAAGVAPCVKHWPGLGPAAVDPHHDLPWIPDRENPAPHLHAFTEPLAAGCPLVMSTHLSWPSLAGREPVTMSATACRGLLRERSGFRGVLVTDDLEMGAMTAHYPFEETVRRAVGAGHDVLLVCHEAARQRLAHRTLREGLESEAEWIAEDALAQGRLDRLCERTDSRNPRGDARLALGGSGAADRLADEICREALEVHDTCELLSVPDDTAGGLVLLDGETPASAPGEAEEAWGELLSWMPSAWSLERLPAHATEEPIERLVERVARVPVIVVATASLTGHCERRQFLQRLAARHARIVVLLCGLAEDAAQLPRGIAAHVLAHGANPVHQRAIAAAVWSGARRTEEM